MKKILALVILTGLLASCAGSKNNKSASRGKAGRGGDCPAYSDT